MKQTALIGAAAAAMRLTDGVLATEGPATASLPAIRLGEMEVSRLILGSNQFFGFAHGPGAKEMKEFYTDQRVMAVMDEAAGHGVNAVASPPYARWTALWAQYRRSGGKLKTWIAQMDGKAATMKEDISAAVQAGAKAVFIQGLRVDGQFNGGTFDTVRDWLEHIRSLNVPAGIASHRPDVHLEAQRLKFPNDFFFQCLYPNDNFLPEDRDKAVAALARLEKPVVAYKVLAAGRIKPQEALGFVFKHLGKKDGLCVGVFPKDDPGQVRENAALVDKLSSG